jgi:adenylate cyclase
MSTIRRLAAILAADVAGYSRLMAADEVRTLEVLKACRREVVDPAIAAHRGRIVKTTGDGMLVEFGSAVDAVTCAMAVQDKMASRGGNLSFRIGINVGDIIIDGDDIFGDGVNVATRVENECEPGSVCLSANAYEQIRNKTTFAFEDRGEQTLKNIDRPVRIFAVRLAESSAARVSSALPDLAKPLPLPDKPSIAVLPFQNMSGDPEQDYFADGMVEEIITALSRFHWLFVIARNSSFTYKGKAVDIKQVGRELGVRYVLEGSVRKAGSRVRITGQLIDAITGAHLWADRFEGSLESVFDLQDEVASCVVGALDPKLLQAEIARAKSKPVADLAAYDCFMRGMDFVHQWTKESNEEALRQFRKSIELDPEYAPAHAHAAWCLCWRKLSGVTSEQDRRDAERFASDALRLGKDDAHSLTWAGYTKAVFAQNRSEIEEGAALIDRAMALNPNFARSWNMSGMVRAVWLDQPEIAIEHLQRAMRLSPLDQALFWMELWMSRACFSLDRYEEAAHWVESALRDGPAFFPQAAYWLTVSRACAGDLQRARSAGARLLQMVPGWRISTSIITRDVAPELRPKLIAALRSAGLPE